MLAAAQHVEHRLRRRVQALHDRLVHAEPPIANGARYVIVSPDWRTIFQPVGGMSGFWAMKARKAAASNEPALGKDGGQNELDGALNKAAGAVKSWP